MLYNVINYCNMLPLINRSISEYAIFDFQNSKFIFNSWNWNGMEWNPIPSGPSHRIPKIQIRVPHVVEVEYEYNIITIIS
jgi:hypothetical protein